MKSLKAKVKAEEDHPHYNCFHFFKPSFIVDFSSFSLLCTCSMSKTDNPALFQIEFSEVWPQLHDYFQKQLKYYSLDCPPT